MKKTKKMRMVWLAFVPFLLCLNGCGEVSKTEGYEEAVVEWMEDAQTSSSVEEIPEYNGNPFVVINDNQPSFTEEELTTSAYEEYSELDALGRCGVAEACIGQEIMPTEERGEIGQIKPSGWRTVKYDFVEGKYLYNRCHLIGFQLAGENANEKNLITGTRYFNVEEMLPFENMVADYIQETDHHVMYRVTPVFEEDDLVATGVEMEAYSVEDEGEGIRFHVFCYNVQPKVEIDYATGESWVDSGEKEPDASENTEEEQEYILNTNSFKYHLPTCGSVKKISKKNKEVYVGSSEELEQAGYEPCKNCILK